MINTVRDRIRGSLIGGAAGDALGYAVEFESETAIRRRFGEGGITGYETDKIAGHALISDDTQMTLFTAAGILEHAGSGAPKGDVVCYVERAYLDWLLTQDISYRRAPREVRARRLMDIPELYVCRAPGNTCLSALGIRKRSPASPVKDYLGRPINNSKGCGGVMRAAPVGFISGMTGDEAALESARIAAITHGHPLGWLPAAALAYIVNRLVFAERPAALADIADDACAMLVRVFPDTNDARVLSDMLQKATALARNDDDDTANVHRLGEGWVGDEALCIALYCCLRHEHSFDMALISSVNHNGDSDSTGAIAGNILGAGCGYEAIGARWKEKLQLSDTLVAIADELAELAFADGKNAPEAGII